MSLIYGIIMLIGGIVMCFTGELLYGIILYAIAGFCIAAFDITVLLKSATPKKPEFDLKKTTELMKEMNKLMDFIDKDND